MRVLIAEADELVLEMARGAVEGEPGFECLVARDGQEAWDLFQLHGADAIISDWAMAPLDGPALCRRVRAADQGRGYTYFLFLTGLDAPGRRLEAMRAGADDYLVKPFVLADLQARLVAAQRVNALHRRTYQAEREARALYDAALSIGGELELGARLERVLDAALVLTGAPRARIALADPVSGEIEVVAARGVTADAVGLRQPQGSGLTGEVLRRNAVVRSDDVINDPRPWARMLAVASHTRSWLGVPLADANGAFGALILLSNERAAFGTEHERLLGSFAALAGAAIREARLRRDVVDELTERRRIDAALRASEARNRALTDALVEAVYEVDLSSQQPEYGMVRYFSDQVQRVMGYSLEEWQRDATVFLRGLHPDDRERVVGAIEALREHGEVLEMEYRWIKPDGQIVWIEDRSRIERDPAGVPLTLRGTNADITVRKRLEEAHRVSEERYRTLIEHLPETACVYRAELDHSSGPYLSQNVEVMLGYTPAEWSADPEMWSKLLHPDDRERVLAALKHVIETGVDQRGEYRMIARDGHVVWVRDEASLLLDAEGRPRYLQGIMLDVTAEVREREQREALLRAARRLGGEGDPGRLMQHLLSEAVALVEADHGLAFRWDEPRGELVEVGNTRPMPAPRPRPRAGQGAAGLAVERRGPVALHDAQQEWGQLTAEERAGLNALVAVPLVDAGHLLGVLVVASTRAGRRFGGGEIQMLELLAGLAATALAGLERSRLQGALLAARTAAHHINNSLAMTVGYSELLANSARLPDDLKEMAREALRGAQQAAETLARLQNVARLAETPAASADATFSVLDLDRSGGDAGQARGGAE